MHMLEHVAEPAQETAYQPDAVELTPGRMYPKERNENATTRHSRYCKAAFARRDWSCHRCCELMVSDAPRDGWELPFFAKKLLEVQRYFLWPHEPMQGGK